MIIKLPVRIISQVRLTNERIILMLIMRMLATIKHFVPTSKANPIPNHPSLGVERDHYDRRDKHKTKKPRNDDGDQTCQMCGRSGHHFSGCWYHDHPDANRTAKNGVLWVDSKGYKAWEAKGWPPNKLGKVLPTRITSDNKKYHCKTGPVGAVTNEGKSNDIGTNQNLLMVTIIEKNKRRQVQALIDTGALPGSFINEVLY
jgi:hypothetical protein